MFDEALDQIRVVRLELHEELMKIPQYRALTALDEIMRIIEKATPKVEVASVPGVSETTAEPVSETPAPVPALVPVKAPTAPKKASKPLTQVQALHKVLREKGSAASLGWLLAELELLGVSIGGVSPRKTLGVALSSNKDIFRRVELEGGRWMWGLVGRKYPGETTYNHLPATEFRSMRVTKK